MKFHATKWFDFDVIWKVAFCLLLVSSVYSFPRPRAKSSEIKTKNITSSTVNARTPEAVETLNSKPISVNAKKKKKIIDKPVFNDNDADNYRTARNLESEETASNKAKNSGRTVNSGESLRQLSIPFMAVPSNWVATFEPANAVILTNKVPLRIWAIGSVAKFPSFLEKIVQRIQSYYSTYKYHDLSRPAAQSIINSQYHKLEPEITDTNDSTETLNFDGIESIDSIDNDPIEEDSTETDLETETPFPDDYFDTTTDINYIDLDENTSTETIIEIS